MTMKVSLASLLWATLYASLTPALAQDIAEPKRTWRCGNTYSDQPCKNGKVVDVSDPRSATDRLTADEANQRTARNASLMERDRLQQARIDAQEARANAVANARIRAEQAKEERAKMPPKTARKNRAGHAPPEYFMARGANATAKKPANSNGK